MTIDEIKYVSIPHKVLPLFDKVFTLPSSHQIGIYNVVETITKYTLDGRSDDAELLQSYLSSFIACMKKLDNAQLNGGGLLMFDLLCAMTKTIGHYCKYGTYDGLQFECTGNILECSSLNPIATNIMKYKNNSMLLSLQ